MTYDDLLVMAQRAVMLQSGGDTLHECMMALAYHTPANRAIAAEKLAMLLTEYVEQSRPKTALH